MKADTTPNTAVGLDFNSVFAANWKKLYTMAYQRLKDGDLAKDIVQDIFVYYLKNSATIRIERSIESYLAQALKYQIIAHYRKNIIHTKAVDYLLAKMKDAQVEMQDLLTEKDLADTLDREISKMPVSMGKVFQLKIRDYTVEEIASKTGMAEKTVRNQISMGLGRIRKTLYKHFPEDFPALCIVIAILIDREL